MNKLKFDKLMNELSYYYIQKDYLVKRGDELESFDFDKLFELGIDEDEFPDNFAQFRKIHIKIDEIVAHCSDNNDDVIMYFFNPSSNEITVMSDTWTIKEALTVINIVMKQQMLDKGLCYEVIFGHTSDNEHFTHYAQESTVFGMWWNDFIKLYQEKIDDISSIDIILEDRNKIHIVMHKKEE